MTTEIIVSFITGVMGPVTLLYVKSVLDKRKKKPDMVKETLKVSELITTQNRTNKRRIKC